jgi:hypothetical protein
MLEVRRVHMAEILVSYLVLAKFTAATSACLLVLGSRVREEI